MTGKIDICDARRLAVQSQGFETRPGKYVGKARTLSVIRHSSYIQIDTISVIKRAHHHILWNRNKSYQEADLDDLQAKDRLIFEYWGHAASYLPMEDYRYYIKRMSQLINPSQKWYAHRLEQCKNHLKPVLQRIREEGPKSTRDFENRQNKPGGWWDWKPAKVALEVLFWRGELMISHRQGFHKFYDLPERVLPSGLDTRQPTKEEQNRFIAERSLNAHGLVTAEDVSRYLFGGIKKELHLALESLVDEGKASHAQVCSHGKSHSCFLNNRTLNQLNSMPPPDDLVIFLSPFDNMVINRDRLRRLFDFDYTIECYLPSSKRHYGYFSLPILFGNRLIGRMDAKAERKIGILIIRHLAFEEWFLGNTDFWSRFRSALKDFARFNGCDTIQIEIVSPEGVQWRPHLTDGLL